MDLISSEQLNNAIKRVTLNATGVPTFVGSAYKHIGVQPLLDAIIK